jgi:hypothetical protein
MRVAWFSARLPTAIQGLDPRASRAGGGDRHHLGGYAPRRGYDPVRVPAGRSDRDLRAVLIGTTWRLACHRRDLFADAANPRSAFTFFTFPAASDVPAARLTGDGHTVAAAVLLPVGTASWLVLSYSVPLRLIGKAASAPSLAGASGTWFLWAVGARSHGGRRRADRTRIVDPEHPYAVAAIEVLSEGSNEDQPLTAPAQMAEAVTRTAHADPANLSGLHRVVGQRIAA